MNRNGEIVIVDDSGRERERYGMVYGAQLLIKEGQKVEAATKLAEWEPTSMPLLTEVAGTLKFEDIIEGVTMNEALDETTGLSRAPSPSRRTPRPARASPSRTPRAS